MCHQILPEMKLLYFVVCSSEAQNGEKNKFVILLVYTTTTKAKKLVSLLKRSWMWSQKNILDHIDTCSAEGC